MLSRVITFYNLTFFFLFFWGGDTSLTDLSSISSFCTLSAAIGLDLSTCQHLFLPHPENKLFWHLKQPLARFGYLKLTSTKHKHMINYQVDKDLYYMVQIGNVVMCANTTS